jgi:hypothetical protein
VTAVIVVTNNGPNPAATPVLTFTTPPNTTFQGITLPPGWACTTPPIGGTGTITCTGPTMQPGATLNFPVALQVNPGAPAGSQINVTAGVMSNTYDPNLTNNMSAGNIIVAQPGSTPVPQPTNTKAPREPEPTNTTAAATNTPVPAATNTPVPPAPPPATNTPVPQPTNTLPVPPTNTPVMESNVVPAVPAPTEPPPIATATPTSTPEPGVPRLPRTGDEDYTFVYYMLGVMGSLVLSVMGTAVWRNARRRLEDEYTLRVK